MVLGLRSKTRKNSLVEVEYDVHVQEIKPWPPSKSLKSVESVFLQCGNGDKISGALSSSSVGDAKIEFTESFRLRLTLCKESKSKGHRESFQKNVLEFHLYESQKDNVIGQLLGSATVNIADYGAVKEITSIYVPMNIKRSFRSTAQPVLFLKVQPFDKDGSTSSSKASLSVTESMIEDNYEEAELAYITDDEEYDCDIPSQQSSRTSSSSALETNKGSLSQKEENVSESVKSHTTKPDYNENPAVINLLENTEAESVHVKGSLSQLSSSSSINTEKNVMPVRDISSTSTHDVKCSSLPLSYSDNNEKSHINAKDQEQESIAFEVHTNAADESRRIQEKASDIFEDKVVSSEAYIQVDVDTNHVDNNTVTGVVDNQETAIDFNDSCTRCSTREMKETANVFDDSKVELESRVEMLEEELREAAVMEIGLYSVVAEHGGSLNKVHAPARRLSRFYLHACKAKSRAKQASAARAAVSGLVLVSKACGNDVPRLAFWLSNSIVLRTIISKAAEELPLSSISCIKINDEGKETNDDFQKIKLLPHEENQNSPQGRYDDLEDSQMFTTALESIEAWIFSRIVESVWWQILTPHMQSSAAKDSSNKKNVKGQGNFSTDLWKKAFKDACESLCPIRAGGHECGCLSVLAKLVMEQLVDRLDVAMFNAILRESAEEMPTDPISDPISDSRVLPIPAGKSNFGAGVQLKNAVGNWSRWLTDLFGIDDDSPEDENKLEMEKRRESETSFKAFHLLNALSDLMMLPLEMLADRSIRKEVCPVFGLSLIERVLNNYVPDEFCTEPIPDSVFDALDSEESLGTGGESVSCFPVIATPPVYSPPLAASLYGIIGEVRNHALSRTLSIIKKSYTSDDELDELDYPISPITSSSGPLWSYKSKGGRNVVRYKLLREVWTTDT